jgi:peptide/nickel transport system permease protein
MAYLIRRLEFFVITLWAAVTINFILPRMMPGNPVEAMMARFKGHLNPQMMKALAVAFGVNNQDPLPKQYVDYLGNMVRLQFGTSLTYFPDSVAHRLLLALPWTLGLVGLSTVIAFALGTLIGMVAAWRRGGFLDSLLPPIFVITSAFPYFWVGLLCLYLFAVVLGWFPIGFGYEPGAAFELSPAFVGQVASHAVLPAFTIVLTSVGGWILTMRNNMITTLAEDYVKMARAKGLSPLRIMLHYAGRNAILPNLTGFAMSLGFVISGALLVEIVFAYPGVGYDLLQSVTNADYPLMQALFLLITVAVLVAVVLADVATAWLDPRTRDQS